MDPDRVGVRELRQNLSVYLKRVAAGETLEVTEHGRPVAVLAPLPARRGLLEQMIADGRAIPARGRLEDLPPPRPLPPGATMTISEALAMLRDDER
jgi:prevent-host-death family protein